MAKNRLLTKILGALVSSALPDGNEFLPEDALHSLITNDSIREELPDMPKSIGEDLTMVQLADYVLENAKRVFAILVFAFRAEDELWRAMQELARAQFGDNRLPVTKKDFETVLNVVDTFDKAGDSNIITWTPATIHDFLSSQWQLIAPVFSTDSLHRDLATQSTLPFIEKIAQPRNGAFGQVTGYKVHHSHIVATNNENHPHPREIAVKRIYSQEKEKDRQKMVNSWLKELQILQKMNQLNQPHIVRFLTAFKRGSAGFEDHYLMLEWADGGNLREFWSTFERPTLTAYLVEATVKQILGLSEALDTAHNPTDPKLEGLNFRHGDLKPENILHFKDTKNEKSIGTFKIGDWGLAKQHNTVTVLRYFSTTTSWGTRAYEPPEVVHREANLTVRGKSTTKRSRLYDVWAMGCIALEFIIWLVYGAEELKRFNRNLAQGNSDGMRFYKIRQISGNKSVAEVHPVVNKWLDHMAKDPIFTVGTTALGNLLEIIKTDLLVVKLPKRLATVDIASHTRSVPGFSAPLYHRIGSSAKPANETPEAEKSEGKVVEPTDRSYSLDDSIESAIESATESKTAQELPVLVLQTPEAGKLEERVTEPVSQKPSVTGPERVNSKTFRDRMHEMTYDQTENYWFTCQPEPARGPDDDECMVLSQQSQEYQTYDSGFDAIRGPTEGEPSLIVPQTEQVLSQLKHILSCMGSN